MIEKRLKENAQQFTAKTESRQILDTKADKKLLQDLSAIKNTKERELLAVDHIFNRTTPDLDHKKELLDQLNRADHITAKLKSL